MLLFKTGEEFSNRIQNIKVFTLSVSNRSDVLTRPILELLSRVVKINLDDEILVSPEMLNLFVEAWDQSLPDSSNNLIGEQRKLKLVDYKGWMSLKAGELFALCLIWRRKFLRTKPDKNAGSLEWLMCTMRHNATNYDLILSQCSKHHAWAPGFGTLLRFQADYLILAFLQKSNLYDQLIKKCQEEWAWRNDEYAG